MQEYFSACNGSFPFVYVLGPKDQIHDIIIVS